MRQKMNTTRTPHYQGSMKHPLALFLLLFLPGMADAQTEVLQDSTTRSIDATVWRPFVRAFNAQNADAYLTLHAMNVVRWPLGWGAPQVGDSVRVQTRRQWSNPKHADEHRVMDLGFTHRSHTDSFAYDVGYYRVTVTDGDGTKKEHVGLFNVILGREDGRWKIFLDADNGEGVVPEDLKKGVALVPD